MDELLDVLIESGGKAARSSVHQDPLHMCTLWGINAWDHGQTNSEAGTPRGLLVVISSELYVHTWNR